MYSVRFLETGEELGFKASEMRGQLEWVIGDCIDGAENEVTFLSSSRLFIFLPRKQLFMIIEHFGGVVAVI